MPAQQNAGQALRRAALTAHHEIWFCSEHDQPDSVHVCYRLHSCLSSVYGGLVQFWPILLPVLWTHFLHRDNATAQTEDGFAMLGRNSLLPLHDF